jgi:hypothetical protein
MGVLGRNLCIFALSCAVAGLVITATEMLKEPQPVGIDPGELRKLVRVITITIPDECVTATAPTPECTKAWDANRIHFFGQQAQPASLAGSGEGDQP